MKSNRASGTKPEVVLAKLLRRKLVRSGLLGRPDFVYPRQKVAVFVNGCFWHRCPVCDLSLPQTNADFWRRKFERNVERDRLNREELEAMDWQVIIVWEHELKESPDEVVSVIKGMLAARHSQSFSTAVPMPTSNNHISRKD